VCRQLELRDQSEQSARVIRQGAAVSRLRQSSRLSSAWRPVDIDRDDRVRPAAAVFRLPLCRRRSALARPAALSDADSAESLTERLRSCSWAPKRPPPACAGDR
jgi:hypothetical protein